MYESYYGLHARPFAAAADPNLLVGLPPVTAAIERLDRCVRDGAGVAVLTASAGLGKTHMCQTLAVRWGTEFAVALLPNASFNSRRGFLQALLYELGRPYLKMTEPELRLELTATAREVRRGRAGTVLILDEAHRLSMALLEELRMAANLLENGRPLLRIVLAGQLELEEKLADPELRGMSDRIGMQVNLPRLTAEESALYLRERVSRAGGELEHLFEPLAIDTIVRVCGGSPRCLNQMADHALLLGYIAERQPVCEPLVREALDDLKRLPLPWAEPLPHPAHRSSQQSAVAEVAANADDELPELGGTHVIEVGGDAEFDSLFIGADQSYGGGSDAATFDAATFDPVDADDAVEYAFADEAEAARPAAPRRRRLTADRLQSAPPGAPLPEEEAIADRLARLDAQRADWQWHAAQSGVPQSRNADTTSGSPHGKNALELVDRLEPLVAAALDDAPQILPPTGRRSVELQDLIAALEQTAEIGAVATAKPNPSAPDSAAVEPQPSPRATTLFRNLRRQRAENP